MSTSLQQRFHAWIAAPAYPWVTGGVLTAGAVTELIAFPGSVTTTVGVLVSAASLMWRRSFPPVAMLTVAAGQIATTARSSMAELRRLLGVLRTPRSDTALTEPQPTLDHLAELMDQHRAVGGTAELRITGDRVVLPAAWELSAYRIIQEALTNVRKHAPGARTVVEVDYGADRVLRLHIRDDGPAPGARPEPGTGTGTGHGLTGMRERAALVGGGLRAGAGPDGGFLVEAELPWGTG
ncbi:sensor histidine kinase [Streptomyces sp. WG4]|uniref:sensor histidine kinase n=1 Tax=Streptomyces sp. WG4 TaxID=3417649 RepID=UPI003CF69C9E